MGHFTKILLLSFIIGSNGQSQQGGYFVYNPGQKDSGDRRGRDRVPTLAACLDYCNGDPACRGFDWDNGKNECYTFNENDMCNRRRSDDRCCVHYQKQDACCPGRPFTIFNNSRAGGAGTNFDADRINNVDFAERCQTACCETNCIAFSFERASRRCYIHHDNRAGGCVREAAPGITLYTLQDRCQLDTRGFTIDTNSNKQGGTVRSNINNENQCLTLCRNDPDCVSTDWNKPNQQCYWHSEQSECNNDLISKNDCTHYTRINLDCTPDNYLKSVNRNMGGGTQLFNVNNVQECRRQCDEDSNCAGFDWDKGNKDCYTHTRESLCPGDFLSNNNCCDNYLKIDYCAGVLQNYRTYPGQNKQGGERANGVSTLAECGRTCDQATSCGGFDFNNRANPNECWLFTDASECNGNQLLDNQCCAHYTRINLNCQGPPAGQYRRGGNSNIQGGNREINVFTESECEVLCTRRGDSCGGFDWDVLVNQCWLHSLENECRGPVKVNNCCTHYNKLSNNCQTGGSNIRFTEFPNSNRIGAQHRTTINNEASCVTLCDNDSSCGAIDWNRIRVQCWTFTVSQECNSNRQQLMLNSEVDHWVKNTACSVN